MKVYTRALLLMLCLVTVQQNHVIATDANYGWSSYFSSINSTIANNWHVAYELAKEHPYWASGLAYITGLAAIATGQAVNRALAQKKFKYRGIDSYREYIAAHPGQPIPAELVLSVAREQSWSPEQAWLKLNPRVPMPSEIVHAQAETTAQAQKMIKNLGNQMFGHVFARYRQQPAEQFPTSKGEEFYEPEYTTEAAFDAAMRPQRQSLRKTRFYEYRDGQKVEVQPIVP